MPLLMYELLLDAVVGPYLMGTSSSLFINQPGAGFGIRV